MENCVDQRGVDFEHAYLHFHITLLCLTALPYLYSPPIWGQTSRVATGSWIPATTKQTILSVRNLLSFQLKVLVPLENNTPFIFTKRLAQTNWSNVIEVEPY